MLSVDRSTPCFYCALVRRVYGRQVPVPYGGDIGWLRWRLGCAALLSVLLLPLLAWRQADVFALMQMTGMNTGGVHWVVVALAVLIPLLLSLWGMLGLMVAIGGCEQCVCRMQGR